MLPSGLDDVIADDEDLARFLTQSNLFNKLMAKPACFLPSRQDRETSVFRHGSQPQEQLWAIGREAARERPLYGAAIFKASAVRGAGLDLVADEPPPRHAIIRGWPSVQNDPELEKAQQREIAIQIA